MWLDNLITTGIQQLLVLRLKNPPAMDSISSLVLLWIRIFKNQPIVWNEALDAPRIQEAFMRCMASVDSFPTPKQVLDLLPARPESLKITQQKDCRMPDNVKSVMRDAIVQAGKLTETERLALVEAEREHLNQLLKQAKIH